MRTFISADTEGVSCSEILIALLLFSCNERAVFQAEDATCMEIPSGLFSQHAAHRSFLISYPQTGPRASLGVCSHIDAAAAAAPLWAAPARPSMAIRHQPMQTERCLAAFPGA